MSTTPRFYSLSKKSRRPDRADTAERELSSSSSANRFWSPGETLPFISPPPSHRPFAMPPDHVAPYDHDTSQQYGTPDASQQYGTPGISQQYQTPDRSGVSDLKLIMESQKKLEGIVTTILDRVKLLEENHLSQGPSTHSSSSSTSEVEKKRIPPVLSVCTFHHIVHYV